VKTICFLLVAITMVFFVSQVQGAEWVQFTEDVHGNQFFFDLDSGSYTSRDSARLWIKIIYSVEGIRVTKEYRLRKNLPTSNWDSLSDTKMLFEINCKTRESKIITVMDFNKNGQSLENYTLSKEQQKWRPISPDSSVDELRSILCPIPKDAVLEGEK
jgi:hypothetical protein